MTFTHGGMPALAGTAHFSSAMFSNDWMLVAADREIARMRRIPSLHTSVVGLEGGRRFDLRPEGWGTVAAFEGDQERYRIERRSWLGRRFEVSGSGFAAEVTSDFTPRRWTIRVGGEPVGRIAGTLWSYNRIEAHADIAVPVGALTLMWHVLARPWEAAAAPGVLRPIGDSPHRVTGPLVTADWLLEHSDDAAARIADTRWYLADPTGGHEAYHEGHIPGAVYVSLDHHLSAPNGPGRHPLPDREDFAVCMGSLGFGNDHLVVAYDDRGGAIASRLWWMLRDIGHDKVVVLDGGVQAWVAAGGSLEVETPSPTPSAMSIRPSLTTQIDRAGLEGRLGSVPLIDARSGERYRGETEPIDPVAGHIPTARNAPYEGNLNQDLTFADAAELRQRFESVGAGDETIVYCGSGVTACHDILAMTVAGFAEPTLYPGSWSDWSTSGGPVATGGE